MLNKVMLSEALMYTFFSGSHRTFTKIDRILNIHYTSLKTEIMQCLSTDPFLTARTSTLAAFGAGRGAHPREGRGGEEEERQQTVISKASGPGSARN